MQLPCSVKQHFDKLLGNTLGETRLIKVTLEILGSFSV